MAEIRSIQQTIVDWADMVITIWTERMSSLGIANAQTHAQSFQHFVVSSANGDVAKVEFLFEYILKFTDMGVGRGVSFNIRNAVDTRRKQKMWFSKTFLLEVKKLANILAANFAHSGTLYVKEVLESKTI
jgi:hypothetical protein